MKSMKAKMVQYKRIRNEIRNDDLIMLFNGSVGLVNDVIKYSLPFFPSLSTSS